MAIRDWLLRCVPGISIVVLLIFVEATLGIFRTEFGGGLPPSVDVPDALSICLQVIFLSYSLGLHIIAFLFPIRLCRAAWMAGSAILRAHQDADSDSLSNQDDARAGAEQSEELVNLEPEVIMGIMLPSYKEDIGVLEDTLHVLASHKLSKTNYHVKVYLAMEERDPSGRTTAEQLIETFRHQFFKMNFTLHPSDIEGEAPGKSSNISWAAKEIEREYLSSSKWRDVLLTTMDSDTHLLSQYFEIVRNSHLHARRTEGDADVTLYMPNIVFDRNAHLVPRLVRVADMMWCGAGLSCFQPKRTSTGIAIPTAVYTIPLALAQWVGGWDSGPQAIGEDMHMMLKCYFATQGRLAIECVPSPASQCNVSADTQGIRGYIANHRARYAQGLRHMWGSLDTGFAINCWLNLRTSSPPHSPDVAEDETSSNRKRLSRSRKLSHTNLQLKLSQHSLHNSQSAQSGFRSVILFCRLFEAHFLPGHLMLVIVASTAYTALLPPAEEHWIVRFCLDLTELLRTLGFITMIGYLVFVYERYHSICVRVRERSMMRSDLHAHFADQFTHRQRRDIWLWPDYFVFPIAGVAFGSIPLFQAAISHFWTDRLVYLVSAKPVRAAIAAVRHSVDIVREEV